jgi:hypothetical protein
LKPALMAAGSSLEHSVKAHRYPEDRRFPDFLDVWSRHYADIPCAHSGVDEFVGSVGGIIEINLLALKGNEPHQTSDRGGSAGDAAFGPASASANCRSAGPMAIGKDRHINGSVAPLDGLAHGAFVQASTLYDYAEALRRARPRWRALCARNICSRCGGFPRHRRRMVGQVATARSPCLRRGAIADAGSGRSDHRRFLIYAP